MLSLFIGILPSKEKNVISVAPPCSSELSVEKNRTFKSADENGADFKITLKNTSETLMSFELTAANLSKPCSNEPHSGNGKSSSKNVDLDISFNMGGYENLSNNKVSNKNILVLKPNESKEFTVHVLAPSGSQYNTWGCIEVTANAIECKPGSSDIILSVYLPDPSEK